MSLESSLRIGASALTAQRLRMDVISSNIANVSTTRSADGGPYKKRDVVLSAAPAPGGFLLASNREAAPSGVRVAEVVVRDGVRMVNEPTHPDADESGNVAYPKIDLVEEMTNMMSAVRAYEASVAAVSAAKAMAMKALELGRG